MTDSEQPPSPLPPSSDQPLPPTDPSPATLRLRAARELFAREWKKSLPRTAQGAVIVDPIQNQYDAELDNMRISAIGTCLVNAGLITADDLSNATAELLEERNAEIGQLIVASRLRGRINGHGG